MTERGDTTDDIAIQIQAWDEYQHYSRRNPPWIKLHTKLLESDDWGVISGDAAKLLIELWLLAAKYGTDGTIETTIAKLEWRLRCDSTALATLLNSLRDNGFIAYASTALEQCLRSLDTEYRELPENIEVQSTDDKSSDAKASPIEDTPGEMDLLDYNPEDDGDWAKLRVHYFAPLRKHIWQGKKPPETYLPEGKAGTWDEGDELTQVRHWLRAGTMYADEVTPFFKQVRKTFGFDGPMSLCWVNKSEHASGVREAVGEARKRIERPDIGRAVSGVVESLEKGAA